MRRRQVLAAVGTSIAPLAGCISSSSSGETGDNTPSSNMTETPESKFPAVSVKSEYNQPSDTKVEVSIVRQFTPDKSAKVEISYTNTGESQRTVDFQASPPFSEYVSTGEEPPRLVIIPDDHSHISPGSVVQNRSSETESSTESQTEKHQLIPESPIDGCWKIPTSFAVYGVAHEKTLLPGETISEEYTVLGHQKNKTCLPSGSYQFEQDKYFQNGGNWGFTIQLQN